MQLEMPTPEPVMVGRQEPLTIQLVEKRIDGSFDNGWLSDTIIDPTQAVLRQQFLQDESMQSVLYAVKPKFQPVSERFVQIINTHPNDRGLHCSVVPRPEILRAMFGPLHIFLGAF